MPSPRPVACATRTATEPPASRRGSRGSVDHHSRCLSLRPPCRPPHWLPESRSLAMRALRESACRTIRLRSRGLGPPRRPGGPGRPLRARLATAPAGPAMAALSPTPPTMISTTLVGTITGRGASSTTTTDFTRPSGNLRSRAASVWAHHHRALRPGGVCEVGGGTRGAGQAVAAACGGCRPWPLSRARGARWPETLRLSSSPSQGITASPAARGFRGLRTGPLSISDSAGNRSNTVTATFTVVR
jgi:hypothetical protein